MFKIFIVLLILLVMPKGGLSAEPLNINYGANFIDLNGDGFKDLITKVYVENGNSHSFDRYQIAVNKNEIYQAVSLENDSSYKLDTVVGADCKRKDFLFYLKDNNLIIIKASIPDGETTFCEEKEALFETFKLIYNKDFITGFPEYYLKLQSQKHSENLYQDINLAIKQELP